MHRVLRWVRNGFLALIVVILVAAAFVYVVSERVVRRHYDEPLVTITVPSDTAAIAEGRRLAQLRGCAGGCHGRDIEGAVFVDELLLARIVAPNLTAAARRYSDPELARIIRRGVRPDGRSVVVMPSEMFSALDDADLGKILAYLHSVPPHPGPGPSVRLGPLARLGIVLRKYEPAVPLVRRADSLERGYPTPGDSTAAGAYLARTACTECHGLDLGGAQNTPDLRIAAGYSAQAFTRLMRTGRALGDREVGLMSEVARNRFSHLTDSEIASLHTYLLARAADARSND